MTDATTTPTDKAGEPVAWARRWYIDGETPVKERNANGRMAWPRKFTFHEVTKSKCFPDDAALYTHPQPSLSVGLDREAVARVIDPNAWAFYDRHKANGYMNVEIGLETRTSLAKADAILALAAPAEGWRPIETAPKDGTAVLAGSKNHDVREVVCWQDGIDGGSMESIENPDQPCEGWVNDGPHKDRFWANPRYFTHWMPLPAAPTGEKGA